MLLLLLSLFANGDTVVTYHWWVPPGFPQKPASYSDWGDYSFYQFGENDTDWAWIWEKNFSKYSEFHLPQLTTESLIPYALNLEDFKNRICYGDSQFGAVFYDVDTSLLWDDKSKWVSVFWSPHSEVKLDTPRIIQFFYPAVPAYYKIMWPYISDYNAIDDHFDVLHIGSITGYRHRGRWRKEQGDGQWWQPTGSFTMYFIPTEKFDFHIICRTLIYLYNGNPWEGYPEEMLDTLARVIIKTYPDRILELERAVEETFRPK